MRLIMNYIATGLPREFIEARPNCESEVFCMSRFV